MDWFAAVDGYCERVAPGLWGEPLNAVSNVAFWVAAWGVWTAYQRWCVPCACSAHAIAPSLRTHALRWEAVALGVMLILIGAGSLTFHMVATRWASALDVLLIALYLHFYLAVYLHHIGGLRWRWAWLGVPLFWGLNHAFSAGWTLLAGYAGDLWLQRLSGASGYLAAWSILLMLVAHSAVRQLSAARPLALAASCFIVSLLLRQLDLPLCKDWPLGTHFMWHLLNAVTLGLTLWAMVLPGGAARSGAGPH